MPSSSNSVTNRIAAKSTEYILQKTRGERDEVRAELVQATADVTQLRKIIDEVCADIATLSAEWVDSEVPMTDRARDIIAKYVEQRLGNTSNG